MGACLLNNVVESDESNDMCNDMCDHSDDHSEVEPFPHIVTYTDKMRLKSMELVLVNPDTNWIFLSEYEVLYFQVLYWNHRMNVLNEKDSLFMDITSLFELVLKEKMMIICNRYEMMSDCPRSVQKLVVAYVDVFPVKTQRQMLWSICNKVWYNSGCI
eukprot:887298_1